MHYILSILSYFLFCFFFFFCNSYFVQLFTFFNYCLFSSIFHPFNNFFFQFSFDFLQIFFFLYIFLNSTVSLCSTFYLLRPFLFHLNFHINFFLLHFHLPPLFLPSYLRQKGQYSLSFSNFFFVFVFGGFFFFNCFKHFFFSTNGYFCYC